MQEDLLLRAMRTQFEKSAGLPFAFNESAARAGAASGKKSSWKRKLEQKSAFEQLLFGTQICTLAHLHAVCLLQPS